MYKGGMSITEVCKSPSGAKYSLSTIRRCLLDAGVLRTREESTRIAKEKGKFEGNGRKNGFVMTEEMRTNVSRARVEWSDKNAIGLSLKPTGYLEHTKGENKGRSQHVTVMESIIGRRLLPDECVHHVNEIKTDNRPENLKLMTVQEHCRHHSLDRLPQRTRKENGQFDENSK